MTYCYSQKARNALLKRLIAASIIVSFCVSQAVAIPTPVTQPPATKPIKVYFLNPRSGSHDFWGRSAALMRSAAKDLGIELIVYDTDYDRYAIQNYVQELSHSVKEEAYLLLRLPPTLAREILEKIERSQLKLITLERGQWEYAEDHKALSKKDYSNWLGEIFVDDEKLGYRLAESLTAIYDQRYGLFRPGISEKRGILGLSGGVDGVSLRRNEGLKRFIEEHPESGYELLQIVSAKWSEELAFIQTKRLLKRHQNIAVIWTAADRMALGALKAYQENTFYRSRSRVVIGGVDAHARSLLAIDRGDLDVSIGGHFVLGACALIWIYDFHHGVNRFNNRPHDEVLVEVTSKNAASYLSSVDPSKWQPVNFKSYSLLANKEAEVSRCPNFTNFKQKPQPLSLR